MTFWYKGGAESNGYDGLFVYVKDAPVMEALEGPFGKWQKATFNVPGGEVTLEFRMDSDPSCSNDPSPPAGCQRIRRVSGSAAGAAIAPRSGYLGEHLRVA